MFNTTCARTFFALQSVLFHERQPAHFLWRCPVDRRNRLPRVFGSKHVSQLQKLARFFDRESNKGSVAVIIQSIAAFIEYHGLVIKRCEAGAITRPI